jgi:hypothetical protein
MTVHRLIRPSSLRRALAFWALLLGFAVINGLFRQRVLEPALGPEPAHVLATTTLAGAVFVAALFFVGLSSAQFPTSELLAIGLLWAVLTGLLELGLGLARGLPSSELLADYDVTRGRLFGLVLLSEIVSPPIAGFLRRLGR